MKYILGLVLKCRPAEGLIGECIRCQGQIAAGGAPLTNLFLLHVFTCTGTMQKMS